MGGNENGTSLSWLVILLAETPFIVHASHDGGVR